MAGIRSIPATADAIWVSQTKAMAGPSSSRIGWVTADRWNQPRGTGSALDSGTFGTGGVLMTSPWSRHCVAVVARHVESSGTG